MTVSSTQVRVAYTTDGVSNTYPIPFLFYANTDLLVMLDSSQITTGFSITGAGAGSGTLTASPTLASGHTLQIILNVPLTQQVNLVDGTAFPSATINQENDRAIQASLRLNDLIGRALRAPDGDAAPSMLLPSAAQRALMYQAYDAGGNAIVVPSLPASNVPIAFLGDVSLYGAKGDGIHDDTAAIQAAINVMQGVCGRVYLPPTTASYKVTAPLIITAGVSIVGDGFSPYTPNDFNTRGPGSWIQFAHLGQGIIINNGSADVTTAVIEKIGTFRNQPAPGLGWTPIAADYDIYIGDADVHIRDVMLWNPTKGIQINSAAGARIDIDGLYGQPLQMGIDCFLAEDVVRIRNVHFWPYWDNDTTYVQAYMRANLIGLQFERCDNPIVSDFFCIVPKYGICFTSNVNGFTQRAQLSNIGIDVFQTAAIIVLAGADGTSFTVHGLYGFSGSNVTDGIRCNANNCLIQAVGVRFSQLGFCGSTINGTGNVAMYTNWIVDGYNGANNSSPGFFTLAGNKTQISDKVTATATNAASLISSTLASYNAIVAEGAWSMVNPATSVVITHGLGWSPAVYQIALQFNSAPNATTGYYVDTITTTQFTIHGNPAGTTNGTWTVDGRTP